MEKKLIWWWRAEKAVNGGSYRFNGATFVRIAALLSRTGVKAL